MSYPAAPPGITPRPAVVSAASALLFLVAGLELVSAVLSVLTVGPTTRVYDDLFADVPNSDTAVTAGTISIYVAIAFAVLLAVAYLILGIFVNRGKNPARIVTWVLAGFVVLCTGCGLAATSAFESLGSMGTDTSGGPTPAEVRDAINAEIPGWLSPVTVTLGVITIIALLTVIVLLALPASNAYFRKPEPVWTPPTWTGDSAAGQPPAMPPYQPPPAGPPPPGSPPTSGP